MKGQTYSTILLGKYQRAQQRGKTEREGKYKRKNKDIIYYIAQNQIMTAAVQSQQQNSSVRKRRFDAFVDFLKAKYRGLELNSRFCETPGHIVDNNVFRSCIVLL